MGIIFITLEYLKKMLLPKPLRSSNQMRLEKYAPSSFLTKQREKFSRSGYPRSLSQHVCIQVKGCWCAVSACVCMCGCMWRTVTAAAGHSSYSISCWRGNTISFAASIRSLKLRHKSSHSHMKTHCGSGHVCLTSLTCFQFRYGKIDEGRHLFMLRVLNAVCADGVTIAYFGSSSECFPSVGLIPVWQVTERVFTILVFEMRVGLIVKQRDTACT